MIGIGPREPRIEITALSDLEMKFTLYDTDVSIANALRRIMIAEVPTLAIDLVTIEENTSVLFDEFICHRMGLLPINSKMVDMYKFGRDCSCISGTGCPFCTVKFELDVTCLDNLTRTVTHLDITSDSLMESNGDHDFLKNKDNWPMPVPRNDGSMEDDEFRRTQGIPIVKLKKNQSIKMSMVANKGVGKAHAKYIPCGTVVFSYEPEIRINSAIERNLTFAEKRKIVNACPSKSLDVDDSGRLVVANTKDYVFTDQCEEMCASLGYEGLLTVSQKSDRFLFTVQSIGQRTPVDILKTALDVLAKKLKEVSDSVSAMPDEHLTVV